MLRFENARVANDSAMKEEIRAPEVVPDSPVFNRYAAYHVTGPLDVEALRAAWAGASFAGLRLSDARPAPDPGAVARRLCARWAAEPFTGGDRARLCLVRTGSDTHVLLLVARRCLGNEATFAGLVTALSHGYAAAVQGRAAAVVLPPLPRSDGERPWWSEQPPGSLASVLPADRGPGAGPSDAGAVVRFDWGGRFGQRMGRLARAEGRSCEAVVLAGFTGVLARHGGDGDRAATFRRLLARTPQVTDRPQRVPPGDALFAHRPPAPAGLVLPGAETRPLPVHSGLVAADLTLVLERTDPTVAGRLEFRTDLFDALGARRFLGQLRTFLDAALAVPDVAVAALPLESAARLRAAARALDARQVEPYGGEPVHLLVRAHSATCTDFGGIAVDTGEHRVGYRELTERASSLAAVLRAAGVVPGGAVAVRMRPGAERIAALLAVMEAGGTLLWLGTGPACERNRAMLERLRPACLVTQGPGDGDALVRWYAEQAYGTVVDAAAPAPTPARAPARSDAGAPLPAAAGAGAGGAVPVRPGDTAYVAFTSGSTGTPKGIPQTHAALAQFARWMGGRFAMGPGARVAQWVAPEHDPALAEVCATLVAGGTLCPVPERIRVNPDKLVPWLAAEGITHLQTVPSFARDLLDVITALPARGRPRALGRLLLMGEALPAQVVAGFRAALPGVRLFNLYGPTETIAATWHEVTAATAGPVPIGVPIPGRQVLVLDDEDRLCPAGVTGHLVVRSPYVTPGYLGGRDDDAFRPPADRGGAHLAHLADGDGEDGPGLAGTGWYRTGDLARRRFDGTLEFRGRRDFQVKLFGNRVELTEIEAALAAHDTVAECAVVARANEQGLVTRLAVYVVPRRDERGAALGDARQWREELRRRFGPPALPATFTEVPGRLPRNAAGKVDRSRLL